MIYQLYKKQVEAWKERFLKGENEELTLNVTHGTLAFIIDLESSRHKDTIELVEAIIKEVEGIVQKWEKDGQSFTKGVLDDLRDLLTKLQAELTLLKNER